MTYKVKKVENNHSCEYCEVPTVKPTCCHLAQFLLLKCNTPIVVDIAGRLRLVSTLSAAASTATSKFFPSFLNWLANSTIKIPFLADRPINIISAIWL